MTNIKVNYATGMPYDTLSGKLGNKIFITIKIWHHETILKKLTWVQDLNIHTRMYIHRCLLYIK